MPLVDLQMTSREYTKEVMVFSSRMTQNGALCPRRRAIPGSSRIAGQWLGV